MKRLVLAFLIGIGPVGAACAGPVEVQAAADDARAAWRLGLKVRNGDGEVRDAARALALLRRAAEGGVPAAMFVLANMLAAGEGAARDEIEARRWLEEAAARAYPEALQQLALTEPDRRKADLLMRQAAHALGHRGAD